MLYNVMGNNYKRMGEYVKAENNYIHASHIVPHRIYPFYLLAKLYVETGDTVKAKEMAHLVMTKEPKVQSTAVREMREEMRGIIND
jgi:phosphopantetheine adenylyltransferase